MPEEFNYKWHESTRDRFKLETFFTRDGDDGGWVDVIPVGEECWRIWFWDDRSTPEFEDPASDMQSFPTADAAMAEADQIANTERGWRIPTSEEPPQYDPTLDDLLDAREVRGCREEDGRLARTSPPSASPRNLLAVHKLAELKISADERNVILKCALEFAGIAEREWPSDLADSIRFSQLLSDTTHVFRLMIEVEDLDALHAFVALKDALYGVSVLYSILEDRSSDTEDILNLVKDHKLALLDIRSLISLLLDPDWILPDATQSPWKLTDLDGY